MNIHIRKQKKPAIVPQQGCDWADTMVLNPAIIRDPDDHDTFHMLFRSTGPWPRKSRPGAPNPYPIFLGYAVSHDRGETWNPDFSRPALAPILADKVEDMYVTDTAGRRVVNHANGCIEDPRWFSFEGKSYIIAACRMFPPGAYWDDVKPTECAPPWALTGDHPFGLAASANVTVNVLFEVDLPTLFTRRYEDAFKYVTKLTHPEFGEDRDVLIFPERLKVDGKEKIVFLHRPQTAHLIDAEKYADQKPSIFIAACDHLDQCADPQLPRQVYAEPRLSWESDRVGGSTPPMRISNSEWLLPYHAKKDPVYGYTQSFMILREKENGFPEIIHRCGAEVFRASEPWEMPNRFKTPCVFTTAIIEDGDDYVMSYGAADEVVGVARVDKAGLLRLVRQYNANGERNSE